MSAPYEPKYQQATSPPPYSTYPAQAAPPPVGFVAPQQYPPQQYPPQQPPGYSPYAPAPGHGATNVMIQPPAPQVVLINGCPACRSGVLEDGYSLIGVLCAIVFFPLGILCCLAMRERRCTNCRASF